MKNEFTITTAEVIRGLDSIGLPQIERALSDKWAQTQSDYDHRNWQWAAKSLQFAIDIKTRSIKYRSDLTPNQKAYAIRIIKQYANPQVLIDMDLYEEKPQAPSVSEKRENLLKLNKELTETESIVKEVVDELHNATDERAISGLTDKINYYKSRLEFIKKEIGKLASINDRDFKLALQKISPHFDADSLDLKRWIEEQDSFARNYNKTWLDTRLPEWGRAVAISYISDYREQLDEDTLLSIQSIIPSAAERDTFFIRFTPEYMKFMLEVLKYALATGAVGADKNIDEFIRTQGRGPKPTKRKVRHSMEEWKACVEKIQAKLDKAASAGKLANFGDYVLSPESFDKIIKEKPLEELTKELSTRVEYTPEQKQVAHDLIKYLAEVCDYANTWDFQGFNKPDAVLGHRMAAMEEIPDELMPRALFYCNKYRKQLPIDSLEFLGLVRSSGKPKKAPKPVSPKTTKPIEMSVARYLTASIAING